MGKKPRRGIRGKRCGMSLYKIDGFVLSVSELYTWIAGFVTLYRKGRLRRKHIPESIVEILHREKDDKAATQEILVYLKSNEDYMAQFVRLVKDGVTDLAIEREQSRKTQ